MIFDNQYLTYNEYINIGGEQIGETPFNLLEFECRKQIDLKTQSRLKDIPTKQIPQDVRLCLFNLINSVKQHIQTKNSIEKSGNLASESIDGYSVSYITSKDIKDVILSKNVEINDIIISYLYGVVVDNEHVIFCGVQ